MSLSQFSSFPPPPPSTLSRTSPPSSQPQISAPSPAPGHRQCCENGRPILTDPHTGQTVCSCQYPPPGAALISSPFPPGHRGGPPTGPPPPLPPGLESVYNASAFAAAASQGYVGLGAEGSAFYSPLGTSPYDLKESAEAWRTLAASQPGFPYDPMALYPYGPGKNATRENTNTLKAWLYEHRKNPYPTKGEKIMLAIITKMTLTQVSTWFANARRRLKKENKMTWSPRNRSEDGSDDVDNNEDDDDCGAPGEGSRRRDVMTPTQELDMTSSKPSSPLLSADTDHHPRPPLKERIIRVDVDEDEDDDDDYDEEELQRHHHHGNDNRSQDMETSPDSVRSRPALLEGHPEFGAAHSRHLFRSSSLSRDRSPIRDDSSRRSNNSSNNSAHLSSNTASQEHSDHRRSPVSSGDSRKSPVTPLQRPGVSSPTSSCASGGDARRSDSPSAMSPSTASPAAPPPKPKIWSISDVINTTSSSSSSTSSSSSSSSLSSQHHHHSSSAIISSSTPMTSSLISSSSSAHLQSRGPSSFLPPPPSSPHQRPHPGGPPHPGFFFLPSGAHWPPSAAAAAARFAGFGGAAYPLSLSHPTLSYPYGLAQPGSAAVAAAAVAATRAGLEAQAQAAHLAAAARAAAQAAEGAASAASRSSSREEKQQQASPHSALTFPRLEASRALFSPGRDADGIRSQGLPPPRIVVDPSI